MNTDLQTCEHELIQAATESVIKLIKVNLGSKIPPYLDNDNEEIKEFVIACLERSNREKETYQSLIDKMPDANEIYKKITENVMQACSVGDLLEEIICCSQKIYVKGVRDKIRLEKRAHKDFGPDSNAEFAINMIMKGNRNLGYIFKAAYIDPLMDNSKEFNNSYPMDKIWDYFIANYSAAGMRTLAGEPRNNLVHYGLKNVNYFGTDIDLRQCPPDNAYYYCERCLLK